MTTQDFEDILAGPRDLTQDAVKNLLEYSRKEKNGVEYKQDFVRKSNNIINLVDFCKVIVGFLNSGTNCVIIYGVNKNIDSSTNEPVSDYVIGHSLIATSKEDLEGYIRERIWPADIWVIHIKQLVIGNGLAITTIFVGKGNSRPYFYYTPSDSGSGIRSFIRGSAGTYELTAPQLHQFITGVKKVTINPSEEIPISDSVQNNNFTNIITQNLNEILPSLKNPDEFGLYIIATVPGNQLNIDQDSIKKVLNSHSSRDGLIKVMEDIFYSDPIETSQKWYRRRLVPYNLRPEKKCVWIISCHKETSIMIITGIIDTYLKGEKFINPFRLSYEIQRLLQMTKYLYQGQVNFAKLFIDFKYLNNFGYVSYIYNTIEKIYSYTGIHEPIIEEINLDNIQIGQEGDILSKDVKDTMIKIVNIFGMDSLPNDLTTKNGEMYYVQSFKGQR